MLSARGARTGTLRQLVSPNPLLGSVGLASKLGEATPPFSFRVAFGIGVTKGTAAVLESPVRPLDCHACDASDNMYSEGGGGTYDG